MLINEVSKRSGLTKKAIEYYSLHGLVTPTVLENGYREYSEQDLTILIRVKVLRKLELTLAEIRQVLNDSSGLVLQRICIKKELTAQDDAIKKSLLEQLLAGKDYHEISLQLQAMEKNRTISEKLLEAFPGYYGCFICLHFARFLHESIESEQQQAAYDTIIDFLDNLPAFDLPAELTDYLQEQTKQINRQQMINILEQSQQSLENPEQFLAENREMLEQYWQYKQSAAYNDSPVGKLQKLLEQFNSSSGYYDVFIPAMKQLSKSYSAYYSKLETANEKLLAQYPQIAKPS